MALSRIFVAGGDPGYASGGFALLEAGGPLIALASMPKTQGEVPARVDQAVAWFAERIAEEIPIVMALESQHRAAFGKSQRRESDDRAAWCREVVGGIRRECFRLGIPVRLIEPQGWRSAVGVGPGATKKQAWDRFATLMGIGNVRSNEHSRDAALIANAGASHVHLWLMDWKRRSAA